MKMIEKLNGKDLRDGDDKKANFRCWHCNALNIVEKDITKFICSNCKTLNKIYDKR